MRLVVAALSVGLALAAPRPRLPYPVGTCAPSSSPQCFSACAGATCGAADATTAECGVLRYPSITHGKNKTHCLPDFIKTCADPGAAQAGCDRCALWGLMQAEGPCVDARAAGAADEAAAVSPADCERHGWYVVMSALEKDPDAVGGLCASKDHWLVLPTHPCTGIESTDPLCTGPPAERVWAAAAVTTARDKGFLNNSTRRWGALMNAPPWRGQHQQHIHVAYLEEDPPKAQVLPLYLNRTQFSTDVGRPTLLTGPDETALATVFVEGALVEEGGGGGKIAPFEVGAEVAHKAKPTIPYGLFVEPFTQPSSRRGAPPAAGVLVSAVYYWSDKEGLVTGVTEDCSPQCLPF